MADPVELDVPARGEYVGLLRMLVSSLAADRRALDDDRLDDLRLAVSEACNLVVDWSPPQGHRRLVVVCREGPDVFELDVHDGGGGELPAGGAGLPEPLALDQDDRVPLALIRALVDDVTAVSEAGVSKLRLAIRCAPART